MLTSHELFGFMPAALSAEILEHTHANEDALYRATLGAVAQAKKVRPIYLQRQPRPARHVSMVATLSRPGLETAAQALLQGWLLKRHGALLGDFLDALGIPHQQGTVDDLPPVMDDARLHAAVDTLLAKHPREVVVVYLNAFNSMNQSGWKNLDALLKEDVRLQF